MIEDVGLVPSVRLASVDDARFAADAVIAAGIPVLEITMTTPEALHVIEELAASHPEVAVGAGTVLGAAAARDCINAGARFVTSPGVDVAVIAAAVRHRVLVFPGVFTPSDVISAVQADADFVKLFPCAPWDGASYLKSLRAPFPSVQFVAAGGVTLQTLGEFFRAGAFAVGVGSDLIPMKAVHDRDRRWITELARRFLAAVQAARPPRDAHDDMLDRR
jgi:2-dehydro-3-deoxyphosphogluconate aldolase/(4S)-4-hydroxy-2-oxoglutarate aldolase